MTELDTSQIYEWFLVDITTTKRMGGPKIKLVWSCVTDDYRVTEWCSTSPERQPGPRLIELMQRLGIKWNGVEDPTPLLKKGMHLFSKMQRHWPEGADETPEYEFVYESIAPQLKAEVTFDPALKERVKKIVSTCTTRAEAEARLKSMKGDYIPVFTEMVRTGELALS